MKVRTGVLAVLGVAAVAAVAFYLGSYVFPHADKAAPVQTPAGAASDRTADESATAAAADGQAVLGSYGISSGAAPSPAQSQAPSSGNPDARVLDGQVLASLDAPARGMLIGKVIGSGETTGTLRVRVDLLDVDIESSDGTRDRYSLSRGSEVLLYVQPAPAGTNASPVPDAGVQIQAIVRVEPGIDGTKGRIVALNVEVLGKG